MNNTTIILLCAVPVILLLVFTVVVPHFRMERQARALLAQYPGAEHTSVYLPLHSKWIWGKRWEIDAKVAEMTARGWIFLRGLEASPLFMFRAWGGGLTLHFIQPYDSSKRGALLCLNGKLIGLPSGAVETHLTPEEEAEEIAFARDVLEYELLHKEELCGKPGLETGLKWLGQILKDTEDVRKLKELSDYWVRQADSKTRLFDDHGSQGGTAIPVSLRDAPLWSPRV